MLDTHHPKGVHCFHLLLSSLPSAHHSTKGVSFSPSSQSGFNPLRQWSDSASLSVIFQYPLWVPSDHILEEAIFILPRESSAVSSLLKDTRHHSQEGLPHGPRPHHLSHSSASICKMAKVTSFTGEVPPLTSSAGLDIVGISESWQKLDKLVGGDAANWSCCAVCEGEVVIRAKALLTKKVLAKPESGPFHTATRQGW